MSSSLFSSFSSKRGQRGQIIVEYVLLLIIIVAVAVILTDTLVSRDEGSPGILIERWDRIIRFIGEDFPDNVETPDQP